MALCRSCQAPIMWTRTTAGELMPLDLDPVSGGNVVLTGHHVEGKQGGLVPQCKVEPPTLSLFDEAVRYVSHFATCPEANTWRKAPAQGHSPESRDAAKRAEPGAARDRERILALLLERGPLTDEQIADELALNPSTARPRRLELQKDHLVRKVGTGRSKAGRAMGLWDAAREEVRVDG